MCTILLFNFLLLFACLHAVENAQQFTFLGGGEVKIENKMQMQAKVCLDMYYFSSEIVNHHIFIGGSFLELTNCKKNKCSFLY